MRDPQIRILLDTALLAALAAAVAPAQAGRLDLDAVVHGQEVVPANGSTYRAVKTRTENGWERLVVTPQGRRWVRDGLFTMYRSDGSVRERAAYIGGLRQGVVSCYAPDGTVSERATWRDGVLHGDRTTFHRNGRPKFHWAYVVGKRQGLATLHREDGTLEELATFVDDRKHGQHVHYEQFAGERRTSRVVDFVAGKQHGHEVRYRVADGAMLWRKTFVNGLQVGATEKWSPPVTSLTPRRRNR